MSPYKRETDPARRVIAQDLVWAKDELRRVKAKLDHPQTSQAEKVGLRLEWDKVSARKAALEAELGR